MKTEAELSASVFYRINKKTVQLDYAVLFNNSFDYNSSQ